MRPGVTTFIVIGVWAGLRMLALDSPAMRVSLDAVMALTLLFTASRFETRDPPWWAWGLVAIAHTLSAVVHGLQAFASGAALEWVQPMILVMNLAWVAGIAVFVRNLQSSGLAARPSVRMFALMFGAFAAACVGLWVVISGEIEALRQSGWALSEALINVVSGVADALVFVGAVWLIRLVAPMAAGRVARPFYLIGFSAGAYLLLDVLLVTTEAQDYVGLEAGAQLWVGLAGGALMAAAVAQLRSLYDDGESVRA